MLLDMSTYSASHHTIPFSANPLCFVYSTQCFSIFQFFSSMYTGASIKTCQVDNQVQGQTPGTISKFFFNVFIVARPAAQPFPILESQTIQKAKRQWITSFNFFVLFELAGWPNVVDAQQQPPAPAVAKNTQAIRHCYIVFIGHT